MTDKTTRWVRRVKPWNDPPNDGQPWVADARTFDIPETVAACIRNAAPGMVAITLSRRGGRMMMQIAEQAAARRGIRVLWWNGPHDPAELRSPPVYQTGGLYSLKSVQQQVGRFSPPAETKEAARTAPTDTLT